MKALILAGGFAKRLGPIGEQMPKAMLVERGDSIINQLVKKIRAVVGEPIISTNKKFADFFSRYENVLVERSMAEEQKLGAVSAIWNAIETLKIDEDLMVVCADNYFSSDFQGFVASYSGKPLVGVYYVGQQTEMKPEEMATVNFEGSDKYPPSKKSFQFTGFKEKVKPPLSNYVSTGVYLFPKRVFPILEEFCKMKKQDAPGYFIQHLMQIGEMVEGYLFGGEWYDISHKSYLQIFRDGRLVESNDRCIVVEKSMGQKLSLKLTILHADKQTASQTYRGPEVYFFLDGSGEMEISGKRKRVREKDVIQIKPNEPHKVYNAHESDLVFISLGEISETAK